MQNELQPLLAAVQRNCDISDARHAGDYTLCIYLLKMREFFRWEQGYAFQDKLPESDVGEWLRSRERLWESIEEESFADLPVGGRQYHPFDNDALNAALNPLGLVYSGGLGHKGTPHFVLGKLARRERLADCELLVSENEYARDMSAPPAMALDGKILLRRESLRRLIWEKVEEWQWQRRDNAMGRALRCFDFEADAGSALERMTDSLLESALLHERGEVLAGQRLGAAWERMLAGLLGTRTELMIRAVRDHLADASTTLPRLLGGGEDAALHFFFANLSGMRKDLAPGLTRAYEFWVSNGERAALGAMAAASENHWSTLAASMLALQRKNPPDLAARLETLIEGSRLGDLPGVPVNSRATDRGRRS